MILCIHGHRPDKLGGWKQPNPVKNYVVKKIRDHLQEVKPESVILGGDLGVSQWTATICIENNTPFSLVVPSSNFSENWPDHSKKVYQDLCKHATGVVVINQSKEFVPSAIYSRNKYLVSMSDKVSVFYNGSSGITASVKDEAVVRGKLLEVFGLPYELSELAKMSNKASTGKPAQPVIFTKEEVKEKASKVLGLSPKEKEKVDHWTTKSSDIPKEDRPKPSLSDRLAPNRVVEID